MAQNIVGSPLQRTPIWWSGKKERLLNRVAERGPFCGNVVLRSNPESKKHEPFANQIVCGAHQYEYVTPNKWRVHDSSGYATAT